MKHVIEAATHRQVILETLEYLQEHREKWDKTPAVVTYADGSTQKFRLAIGTEGSLMRMWPRSSRRGSRIPEYYADTVWKANEKYMIRKLVLNIPNGVERTPAQWYAHRLRLRKNYFEKYSDPRVWANIRETMAGITEEKLARLEACDCTDSFAAWKMARELDLPQVEPHKTLTIKSCRAPEYVVQGIKTAFGEAEFNFTWRHDYDYHASGKVCADGVYRAWLSQEFKDCSNGHYWLLISPERAMFCEDD